MIIKRLIFSPLDFEPWEYLLGRAGLEDSQVFGAGYAERCSSAF